ARLHLVPAHAHPAVRVAHGLPACRTRRDFVAREDDVRLVSALAAVPLAHQAPRPIRPAQGFGAVDLLVDGAGGLVVGAHGLFGGGAADGFVPADGLAGLSLAVHHAFKAETTLPPGGAGVAPNRVRGAHHLAAGAAGPEARAAGRMAPGDAPAAVRGAMRLAA